MSFWVGDDPDQAVSEELQRGAELLITSGSSVTVAARRQTSTIPIVFLQVGDPRAMGLIESLSRPGRNATGFSDILAVGAPLRPDRAIETRLRGCGCSRIRTRLQTFKI